MHMGMDVGHDIQPHVLSQPLKGHAFAHLIRDRAVGGARHEQEMVQRTLVVAQAEALATG